MQKQTQGKYQRIHERSTTRTLKKAKTSATSKANEILPINKLRFADISRKTNQAPHLKNTLTTSSVVLKALNSV